ncbi:hypothetical protein A3I18_02450 [Candidatus Campbellbacteria bacterium RIFCSPLOWO2_02_FULL_35_11]|uniref:Uncharacterized protein n=2 Tax=Candidatus Campbelliibacteriota TaxID=1752727 RepID=A0A1F5EKX1_9BACT|nr:MAG: hypothetical protein A3E89_02825 [Candidatus Campbellbacteria bacterium RIFCSPHIGHO2_12_FULL_35_10]OGD70767.1 MAG: hypothetical protein A3I18_02450 [Candidatus Campbellbacteria bacterium RIFCSPLOWO2_02_FULL_35_11]
MQLDIYKNLNFSIGMAGIIDLAMLSVLLLLVIWLFALVANYKGTNDKVINYVGFGSVMIGLAHLFEIMMGYSSLGDVSFAVFFHRLLTTIGFVVIVFGLKYLMEK